MKKRLSVISPLSATIVILFAGVMTYFLFGVFAASGTATLYTSPAGTQSVTTGQSFAVNVRISTGSGVPVTGASVYLSYPTSKLQILSQSYAGSAYTTQLIESNSGGVLRMDRAALPAISGGDQLFAQVTFKALASGSAPISFTNSSIVTSGEDDSNILAAKNGVTYNISDPAAAPVSTPSGGSSSSSSGSSGTTTSSSGAGTAKSSSSSSSAAASPTSPSTSSPAGSSSSNAPDATADVTGLAASDSSSVNIVVLDSKNKPVERASVTLSGQTVKTGASGVAHFEGISKGTQSVAISYNGKKTSTVVHVKGASTQASPEVFKVAINRNKFNPAILLVPLVILIAAGVLALKPWKGHLGGTNVDTEGAENIVTSDNIVAPSEAFTQTAVASAAHKQGPGSVYGPGGSVKPPVQSPDTASQTPPATPSSATDPAKIKTP